MSCRVALMRMYAVRLANVEGEAPTIDKMTRRCRIPPHWGRTPAIGDSLHVNRMLSDGWYSRETQLGYRTGSVGDRLERAALH